MPFDPTKHNVFLRKMFAAVLEEGFSLILPLGSGNESNSFHRCSLGAESGTKSQAKPCGDCWTNLLQASVTLLEPKGSIQSVLLPGGLGISIPVSAIWSGKSFITQGVASDYVLQK